MASGIIKNYLPQQESIAPLLPGLNFLKIYKYLKMLVLLRLPLVPEINGQLLSGGNIFAVRIGGQAAFLAAESREGSFIDDPFVQAGEKIVELVATDPFPAGFLGETWGNEATHMGNGETAMDLMGQWAPGSFRENSADGTGLDGKIGWFPFPMVEGGAGGAADGLGGGNGFVVGANAPDAAVDFLKFISSVECQTAQAEIGMSVPVVMGAEVGLTDPTLLMVQQGAAAAEYFQLYYDQYLPPAMGSVVNDAVQTIFAGTATPLEAAQMIEDSAAVELQ